MSFAKGVTGWESNKCNVGSREVEYVEWETGVNSRYLYPICPSKMRNKKKKKKKTQLHLYVSSTRRNTSKRAGRQSVNQAVTALTDGTCIPIPPPRPAMLSPFFRGLPATEQGFLAGRHGRPGGRRTTLAGCRLRAEGSPTLATCKEHQF